MNARGWISAAVIVALIVGLVLILPGVWRECRDEGHSFFYCLLLVSK